MSELLVIQDFALDNGGGGGGGAPANAEYVLVAADAGLPNGRVLTAGAGITIVDGGPGSTLTIAAADPTSDSLQDSYNGGNTIVETALGVVISRANADAVDTLVLTRTLGTGKALQVNGSVGITGPTLVASLTTTSSITVAGATSDLNLSAGRTFAASAVGRATVQAGTGAAELISTGNNVRVLAATSIQASAVGAATFESTGAGLVKIAAALGQLQLQAPGVGGQVNFEALDATGVITFSCGAEIVGITNGLIEFDTGSTFTIVAGTDIVLDATGNIVPPLDNTQQIGTDALRFARIRATNVVTGDLELCDEARNAHFTLREQREYIGVINRTTGQKFKLTMIPVVDEEWT